MIILSWFAGSVPESSEKGKNDLKGKTTCNVLQYKALLVLISEQAKKEKLTYVMNVIQVN